MNKQFFIHGKPSSGESTGKNVFEGLGERITDEVFKSSQQMETPSLKCEIRKWKQSSYSVFTFFRNGLDCYGSQNGFCALTLIVEGYYPIKVVPIYYLLELIYKSGLQDTLHCIDQSGKYLISSFQDVPLLSKLTNDVFGRLDEGLFRKIDQTFHSSTGTEKARIYHPIDVDSEEFFNALRENGTVYISPNFNSNSETILQLQNEANKSSRLQAENTQLREDKEALTQKVSELQKRIDEKLIPTVSQPDKSGVISKLKKENQDLRETIAKLQNKSEPVFKDKIVQDFFNKTRPLDLINILNSLLICLCLFGIFRCTPNESQDFDSDRNTLIQERDSLKRLLSDSDKNVLHSKKDSLETLINQLEQLSQSEIMHSGNSRSIRKNESVTLSIVYDNIESDYLKWAIENGDIASLNNNQLTGKKRGNVLVKCLYHNIIVNRRVIQVTD